MLGGEHRVGAEEREFAEHGATGNRLFGQEVHQFGRSANGTSDDL